MVALENMGFGDGTTQITIDIEETLKTSSNKRASRGANKCKQVLWGHDTHVVPRKAMETRYTRYTTSFDIRGTLQSAFPIRVYGFFGGVRILWRSKAILSRNLKTNNIQGKDPLEGDRRELTTKDDRDLY